MCTRAQRKHPNFGERRKGEVRGIHLLGTSMNKPDRDSLPVHRSSLHCAQRSKERKAIGIRDLEAGSK